MISPESYRAWEEEMAAVRRACLACEQEAYLSSPDTDLGAVMPGVYYHAGRSARRGHGMTRDEHLLTILAEECAEVAQRCSKALRFGIDEVQPGQGLDNRRRIEKEFNDLLGVYLMTDFDIDPGEIRAKQEQVEKPPSRNWPS